MNGERAFRRPARPARPVLAALPIALATTLAAAGALAACGDAGASDARQAEVARRGGEVMPFDLDATTHRFQPVDDGLAQTVVADDPGDEEQVALVRDHLAAEAEAFVGGDYGDPASIHGDDMPGLADLEAGAAEITVVYEPTDDGGRITYTTARPALVEALHRWSEAQVSDHGEHAEGHSHPASGVRQTATRPVSRMQSRGSVGSRDLAFVRPP